MEAPVARVSRLIPFVRVVDVEASVAFYTHLGFAVADTATYKDRLSWASLRSGETEIMFEGTVADNIRFGRPDATDDEVRAAAEAVGADRFIDGLADWYDTDVAKRGGRLSAGQRQLIAFARETLPGFKAPDEIEFGDLPKTSTGKVKKYELRERERARRAR